MSGDDGDERSGDWARAEEDLRRCLLDGRGDEGRDVLFEALQMKDAERRRAALRNGFVMSCRDEEGVANFLRCEREDPSRLRAIGRRIIALPEADGG